MAITPLQSCYPKSEQTSIPKTDHSSFFIGRDAGERYSCNVVRVKNMPASNSPKKKRISFDAEPPIIDLAELISKELGMGITDFNRAAWRMGVLAMLEDAERIKRLRESSTQNADSEPDETKSE